LPLVSWCPLKLQSNLSKAVTQGTRYPGCVRQMTIQDRFFYM
jgi:hypothetical protein